MTSKAEFSDNETYRQQVRQHFLSHIKHPQCQQKFRETLFKAHLNPRPHLKEQSIKMQQHFSELETNCSPHQKSLDEGATSGGDADRNFNNSAYPKKPVGESCKIRHSNDNYFFKNMPSTSKSFGPASATKNNHYCYESEEESGRSQNSSKTVISRKSSKDLRRLVNSQCKLHEVVKEMCNAEVDNTRENTIGAQGEPPISYPPTLSQSKRCCDHFKALPSQKDVVTEISKGDFLDCRNTNTLTISVEDVINSRVVNPMIHKLHRMYLNNLKDKMSLMENLEQLPSQINEVYKSVIFKLED